jgi:hypothetical protein
MLKTYVVGIIEEMGKQQICQIIYRGSQQECSFFMSLIGTLGQEDYFMLPESVYQKLSLCL